MANNLAGKFLGIADELKNHTLFKITREYLLVNKLLAFDY